MKAGDTIPCTCLVDAFQKMDDLIRQGYQLEFEYSRRKAVITIRGVPDNEDN
jgi:hypothetical protein